MNVSPKATISNDFRRKYHNFALCILNYAFDCLACVSKLNNHLAYAVIGNIGYYDIGMD